MPDKYKIVTTDDKKVPAFAHEYALVLSNLALAESHFATCLLDPKGTLDRARRYEALCAEIQRVLKFQMVIDEEDQP